MLGEVYALRQALLVEIDAGLLASAHAHLPTSHFFPSNNLLRTLPETLDIASAYKILSASCAEIAVVGDAQSERRFVRTSSLRKIIQRIGFEAIQIPVGSVSHQTTEIKICGLSFGDFIQAFVHRSCFGALLIGEKDEITACVSVDMLLEKVKGLLQSAELTSRVMPRCH